MNRSTDPAAALTELKAALAEADAFVRMTRELTKNQSNPPGWVFMVGQMVERIATAAEGLEQAVRAQPKSEGLHVV